MSTIVCLLLIQFYLDSLSATNILGRRDIFNASIDSQIARDQLSFMLPEVQNNSEVVAQLGSDAVIRCYTFFLGSHQVSWLRRDINSLLTAGKHVYSSEGRYSVSHVKQHKMWELTIREADKEDSGLYECQLTSHPPVSLFFHLKLIEARAHIIGQDNVHAFQGSNVKFYCKVKHATKAPLFFFWFHNGSMINYQQGRLVTILKKPYATILSINNVSLQDSGRYCCEPYLSRPAHATLHVIPGRLAHISNEANARRTCVTWTFFFIYWQAYM